MSIVAAVFVDFEQAPSGGPSQLSSELGPRTILGHTLRRLAKIEGVSGRCLVVRAREREVAAEALRRSELADRIDLRPLDLGARPRQRLLRAARKWNLTAWRGGLMGTTWFDEFLDARAFALVLNHYKCDGILGFDGHQALLDPTLASAMLAHLGDHQEEVKYVFSQAPPGLAGVILMRECLEDVLKLDIPFGLLLSYRPELAQFDPIVHKSCYPVPAEVMQTAARFVADTRRSRELIEMALSELGDDADALSLCRWAAEPGHDPAGPLPLEIELELTTEDPLPESTLRPRGGRVPRRQLEDIGQVARLAEELAEYDDRLVFLGGHGDPLRHPQFGETCRLLRSGGIHGIGVGTHLVDLSDEVIEALFANQVDVVEVRVDAHSAETYRRVHGVDVFGQVRANIERLEQTRRQRSAPQPILVCSLTRCAATIDEMESFFDDWIRDVGSAVIHGYNTYCGALPADTLLPTTPTTREPCRRLGARLMLLADGTVAQCAQDFEGRVSLGTWTNGNLRDTWQGRVLGEVRRAHNSLVLKSLPICEKCSEWGRP